MTSSMYPLVMGKKSNAQNFLPFTHHPLPLPRPKYKAIRIRKKNCAIYGSIIFVTSFKTGVRWVHERNACYRCHSCSSPLQEWTATRRLRKVKCQIHHSTVKVVYWKHENRKNPCERVRKYKYRHSLAKLEFEQHSKSTTGNPNYIE